MAYNIYEWKINPKSSFMTKLQSDTIWGHIIWAIRYLEGEEYLENILEQFEDNNSPFIVSNGFISGYLPFIKKGIVSTRGIKSILSKKNNLTKQNIKLYTRLVDEFNKIEFIDTETFNTLRKDELMSLYSDVANSKRCPITLRKFEFEHKQALHLYFKSPEEYKREDNVTTYNDLVKTQSLTKNKINRLTNSSEQDDGSGVFTVYETFYKSSISIYIKLRDDVDVEKFNTYLKYIQQNGFGKKASSGKGYFETVSFEKREDLFDSQYEGNGYVVLSNYIPKQGDYSDVVGVSLLTKRGKVSGIYSQNENIFKKPFVCFTPGSVFKGNPNLNKGKMLKGLYYDEKIVQYGIPFILGVDINDK
ncbi:hypothetical protein CHF27_006630 [Romboutsia maritimum]|uniref:CRISPR system Cms protein Csm4 n=1 Tax=Romboutsia maritimum TaxID=2020948 RepID=A0A371ITI1_9FIRM|nr:hypothetical protein [Romboutsia maritimum]RDY23792.1 hypothetical protein CHF27_006630 [Romboutsia maritimum]